MQLDFTDFEDILEELTEKYPEATFAVIFTHLLDKCAEPFYGKHEAFNRQFEISGCGCWSAIIRLDKHEDCYSKSVISYISGYNDVI